MITIIHGDDIEESRQEFVRLKQAAKDGEIRAIDGKLIDEAMLTHATESGSLFDKKILVTMENVFAHLGRKTKRIQNIVELLKKASQDTDILCWEPKELGKETLSLFGKNVGIKLFVYPKIIFSFLDALRENNKKVLLTLLDELLVATSPELVWNMTISRMRLLIQIRSGVIPERLQSWQVSRLTNQARAFTMDRLLSLYKKMADMEYALKTGVIPFTMPELIRQWIVEM